MKIAVALSGGIDSSVALLRLHEEGRHELIGITMKAYSAEHSKCALLAGGIDDARFICDKIGIKHYVINTEKEFKDTIISYFINQYMEGKTPNACLFCNELIKFKILMDFAQSKGYEYFATGHYAIVEKNNDLVTLKKGKDPRKDQSYFLSRLTNNALAKSIFPLGKTTKKENIDFLKERNIYISGKKESQEMCFVNTDDYKTFIKENVQNKITEGNVLNENKEVIGTHSGVPFYTIGQRKGLNVAIGKPAYVREINPRTSEITIGDKPMKSSFVMSSINWLCKKDDLDLGKTAIIVKVRYLHKGEEAFVEVMDDDKAIVNFREPVLAITKGQGAVGYILDRVVFSGIIDDVLD